MNTPVQGRPRMAKSIVLDWLMFALSFGTIAWISFRPIGG
jgi:hypothetical protein